MFDLNALILPWMKRGISFFIAFALLCIAGISVTKAQQQELRRVTQTEATSDCIGDPRTPLCAVETFVACWAREDIALCERVLPGKIAISDFDGEQTIDEYYVESQKTLTEEDMKPELRDTEWHQPGIVFIVLRERWCAPDAANCPDSEFYRFYYSVKHVGQQWQIISWTSDLDSI